MVDGNGDDRTTHFGFQNVPESAKAGLVAGVFDSVAERYDLMNDLMSLGLHRLWKRFAVAQSGVRAGQIVLDVAGGTGDLACSFAERVGDRGYVTIVDINRSMLNVGRRRLADRGIVGNVVFVQADAEALPFDDDHFDCISIGFGLRNVTHMEQALLSMLRVLKPGGCLLVLEFSQPTQPLIAKVYDAYSFSVLPLLGRYVANDEHSYRYLAESIRKHPDPETLKSMMEDVGFERVRYFNLSAGVVALHKAYKL
jgi:demethylmenaquinone methyltransferase/2-methoxy-6-polyprenyl-1,4-benzoquinol methylase